MLLILARPLDILAFGEESAQTEQEVAPGREEVAAEKVGKVRKLSARPAKARAASKPTLMWFHGSTTSARPRTTLSR